MKTLSMKELTLKTWESKTYMFVDFFFHHLNENQQFCPGSRDNLLMLLKILHLIEAQMFI